MRHDKQRRFAAVAAVICLGGMLFHALSPAQAIDWLKTGKELLGSGTERGQTSAALSRQEIAAGLKEALKVGSERVVERLGRFNGFNADPAVHIPLPERFETVRSALATINQTALLDDLELKLNRAAEQATPPARELFGEAIREMTLADARAIYSGPDDAATRYFQEKMAAPLAEEMHPIVADSMSRVGAVQTYQAVMGKYAAIPFVPDIKADLTRHVVEQGMAGIFHYLALEEAAIRQNPAKRTTQLLQQVFGAPAP